MEVGFSISEEGYDATSLNPNQLVASSLFKQLKIIKLEEGRLTIPSAGSEVTVKKAHGLGYQPAFMAFFEYPDDLGRYWIANTLMGNLGLSDYDSDARVDGQNITLYGSRGESIETGDKNIDYSYILFDQPAVYAAGGNDKPTGYTDSEFGVVVSQPGKNANTAKIYEQQFNSNTDYLKYHFTKEGKILYDNSSDGATTKVITHNLGYIPIFMLYGGSTEYPFYSAAPEGRVPLPFIASAGADKTNITINVAWAGGGGGSESFLYQVVVFKNRMVL